MNYTFGICVGNNQEYLENLLQSIENQPWEKYGSKVQIILMFNEGTKILDREWKTRAECYFIDGWLPQKKNKIAKLAFYENLVLLHDYYLLDPNWLETVHFYSMNYSWDILCSRVINQNGSRGADWLINPRVMDKALSNSPELSKILREIAPHEQLRHICGLPYYCGDFRNLQYVSGGYIMCKTKVFLDVPMDESLVPGEPEDVNWSEACIRTGYLPSMSMNTLVRIQKPGKWEVPTLTEEALEIFKDSL